jgi:ribosomal protein L11 methyltransferase
MDTHSVTLECRLEETGLVTAELAGKNMLGMIQQDLPEGRCRLQVFFADDSAVGGLLETLAAYDPVYGVEPDVDWVAMMRAEWEPQAVGERFYLVPSWRDDDAPPGRLRLEMPPGTAAGTGSHPCTQLALQALERLVHPGRSFLDLGTGSGILSAAAHLLGARPILACDIDQEALAAASDYLYYMQVPARLFAGSCRSLRTRSVDVAVANLSAPAIGAVAGSLSACLTPGGRAFLTGFTQREAARLAGPLAEACLRLDDTLAMAGWVGLIVTSED